MPQKIIAAALAAGTAVLASAAAARGQQQNGPLRQEIRQACSDDYHSLCADVQPGGGRIIACLKQNAVKLSPECTKALLEAKAARRTR